MLSSLIFALASAALSLQAMAQSTSNSTACHNYVLISVRGTYELQGPSIAFKNMTANTLSRLANGTEYYLPYPANASGSSATMGSANLTSYINSQVKKCPKQKYAILGYSQGASVTELAIRQFPLGSPAFEAIQAIVLVGNPGHKPLQTSNYDETGVPGNTTYALGSLYNSGLRVPTYWYQSTKVLDICHNGDIVCAPGPGATFILHLRYGTTPKVQTLGTQFLVGQLTTGFS